MDNGPVGFSYPGDRSLSLGSLHPIRSHAPFVCVFVISAALTALGLTFTYSERYLAEANTYFKPAEVTRLSVQETRALGSPVPTTPFKVIGQTLDGLVKSDALLRQAVIELGLDVAEVETFDGPWYSVAYKRTKQFMQEYGSDAWSLLLYGRIVEEDRTAKAIRELRKNTKIISEDSYVFTLRTLAKTPQRAARTANDLARRLIELNNAEDLRSAGRRSLQLEELRARKLTEIAGLQTSIRDLLGTVNAASIDSEIEQATIRASQIELQRTDAAASLRQEDSRVSGLANKLRLPAPSAAARDDDDGRFRPATRLGVDDYAKLTTERLLSESRATGLRARLDVLQRDVGSLGSRMTQLNQVRAESDLVIAQLQGAKRDLVALTDALQETAIKVSSIQPELRIQSLAQAPQAPVSPIKIYHVGLAVVLATVFGTGLAVLFGFFNIRLFMISEKWRTLAWSSANVAAPKVVRIDAE